LKGYFWHVFEHKFSQNWDFNAQYHENKVYTVVLDRCRATRKSKAPGIPGFKHSQILGDGAMATTKELGGDRTQNLMIILQILQKIHSKPKIITKITVELYILSPLVKFCMCFKAQFQNIYSTEIVMSSVIES
jgi:hypothetical protein